MANGVRVWSFFIITEHKPNATDVGSKFQTNFFIGVCLLSSVNFSHFNLLL